MLKKIRKNRKNFYVSAISCGIIFIIGLLYVLVPAYYGYENMELINTNNLFVTLMLALSTLGFGEYLLVGKNPTEETIYFSICSAICGIINIFLKNLLGDVGRLTTSLTIFLIVYALIKCFTIEYLHNKKDAYQYIEILLLIPFVTVSAIMIFILNSSSVVRCVSLGYITILYAILKSVGVSIKAMLKSKRFLRKIKLK